MYCICAMLMHGAHVFVKLSDDKVALSKGMRSGLSEKESGVNGNYTHTHIIYPRADIAIIQ